MPQRNQCPLDPNQVPIMLKLPYHETPLSYILLKSKQFKICAKFVQQKADQSDENNAIILNNLV